MENKETYKIDEKTAKKINRDMNKIPTRKEVDDLLARYTEYMRAHVDNSFDILRETIQAQIIANIALVDLLDRKEIITKEEYEAEMQKIAENIDKMMEELKNNEGE